MWLGLAVGLALVALMALWIDLPRAIGAVAGMGWGIAAVIAFHFVQMVFSSAAWQASSPWPGSGFGIFFLLRWIREGVNNLLPVAQIGGEMVAARLLAQRGQRLSDAGASVTVDLTVEMLTQIGFTLMGLALLATVPHGSDLAKWAGLGALAAALGAAGLLAAQRVGLMKLIERLLLGMADKLSWVEFGTLEGIHDSVQHLYGRRRAFARACMHHTISWLLGGIEIMLIMHFLGVEIGWREALVIESLGQATKAIGFAIPGALAVQEGGYVLVCSAFGIGPDIAVALSLVKRARELALGLPGLAAWHWLEGRNLVARRAAASRTLGSS
jgi:putative membrane protein